MLVLRTCNADLTSFGGFQWPSEVGSLVMAPDWKKEECCGYGLHGLKLGEGNPELMSWESDAKWLVVDAPEEHVVDLRGKVKFPFCTIKYIGDRAGATAYMVANGCDPAKLPGATICVGDAAAAIGGFHATLTGGYGSTLTGGDRSTLTGGYGSTLTGGDRSTLTGGDRSTLTGGNDSTLTGGNRSTLTGGYGSTLTGGDRSTLTGGDRSTLTGGNDSTLTGGNRSTLTGGDRSTLTGGDRSTLTGGDRSTLTGGNRSTLTGGYGSSAAAGEGGIIEIKYPDYSLNRWRKAIGYIGESGLLPNVAYKLNDKGLFVPVNPPKVELPAKSMSLKSLYQQIVAP